MTELLTKGDHMNTWYWDFSYSKPDSWEKYNVKTITIASQANELTEYVVPRRLAELCKFELDHEHDDAVAERSDLPALAAYGPVTYEMGEDVEAGA